MHRNKANEIVGYYRHKAKSVGFIIWPVMLAIGIAGTYAWKWYALIIALILAFLFGSIYSILQTKHIEKITGLDINEQSRAYFESLAAKNDPITKNPKTYKQYIDSLPDD